MNARDRNAGAAMTIATAAMLGAAVCAGSAVAQSAKAPTRDRYLLLDSRIIEGTENATLTVGTVREDKNNPLFKEDRPWEPRFDNPYVSVIYDREEGLYKCWYSIFIQCSQESWTTVPREKRAWSDWKESRDRGFGVCYATSSDGIHWKKPELGIVEFQDSKKNNLVLRAVHGVGVIKDLHETDPQKRYKAIHPHRGHTNVWFSPDGLHWRDKRLPGLDHGDTYILPAYTTTAGSIRDPTAGRRKPIPTRSRGAAWRNGNLASPCTVSATSR